MWIVPAGILNSVEPYSAGNCGSTFQAPFDRFTADCQIYVGLEALSWTLWAVTLIVFVTLILDFFGTSARTSPPRLDADRGPSLPQCTRRRPTPCTASKRSRPPSALRVSTPQQ